MRLDQLESGLRAEAQAIAAPDLGPARKGVARHVRQRRVARLIGLVLALLVPLAVFGLWHPFGGDSSEQVVTNTGQVPHLVPEFMSPLVRRPSVIDLPQQLPEGDHRLSGSTSIYASGSPGDPLGGTSFAVDVSQLFVDDTTATTGQPTGFVGYPRPVGTMRGADFRVSPGIIFEVQSAQLPQTELRALGESVRLGGPGGSTLEHVDAPAGYHQVVADADDTSTAAGMELDATARGYVAVWVSTDPADNGIRALGISVTTAQPDQLDVVRWGLQGVSPFEVNGHTAYLGSLPGGEAVQATPSGHGGAVTPGPRTWMLAWYQDPTTLVIVEAVGGLNDGTCATDCTPSVLEHIADSLAPVSDAQWQAFQSTANRSAPVGTLPAGCVRQSDHIETCTSSGTGSTLAATTTTSGSAVPGG